MSAINHNTKYNVLQVLDLGSILGEAALTTTNKVSKKAFPINPCGQ